MDLRQLEALTAIAEHGSFSAAADALHTVQSNVSTRLSRLERELNVELVDRATRRLTPAGEAVVARSRRIEAEIAAIPSDLAAQKDEIRGVVVGGMIASVAHWLVPALLAELETRLPLVTLQITEAPTNTIVPAVSAGHLDFGLISLPIGTGDLDIEFLYSETNELVVPFGHPIGERPPVTLTELADVPLIVPPPDTPLRDDIDRAFFEQHTELKILCEVNGIRLIRELVRRGVGPAFLPVALAIGDPAIVRIPMPETLPRRSAMIRNRHRAVTVPTEAVTDLVRELIERDHTEVTAV